MDLSQLDDSTRNAYETLLNPQYFALGPVTAAGCTSRGELALDHLLVHSRAGELLKQILEHASYEGKLYALIGLRSVDRAAYLKAVAPLRHDQTPVETLDGCIGGSFPMAEEIRRLEGWPPCCEPK